MIVKKKMLQQATDDHLNIKCETLTQPEVTLELVTEPLESLKPVSTSPQPEVTLELVMAPLELLEPTSPQLEVTLELA